MKQLERNRIVNGLERRRPACNIALRRCGHRCCRDHYRLSRFALTQARRMRSSRIFCRLPHNFTNNLTVDDCSDAVGRKLERVAVIHCDVGVLSFLERPDAIIDA